MKRLVASRLVLIISRRLNFDTPLLINFNQLPFAWSGHDGLNIYLDSRPTCTVLLFH